MGGEPSNSTHRHAYGKRRDRRTPQTDRHRCSMGSWWASGSMFACRLHRRWRPVRVFRGRVGRRRIRRCRRRSVRLARTVAPGRSAHPVRPTRFDPGPTCALSTPAPTFRVRGCRKYMARPDFGWSGGPLGSTTGPERLRVPRTVIGMTDHLYRWLVRRHRTYLRPYWMPRWLRLSARR